MLVFKQHIRKVFNPVPRFDPYQIITVEDRVKCHLCQWIEYTLRFVEHGGGAIFCAEFHPDRSRNMDTAGRNLFITLK